MRKEGDIAETPEGLEARLRDLWIPWITKS
jgi:hypothetical protein